MNSMAKNEYVPDSVSAPGDTLLELLESRGMSQLELAERAGRPAKTINEIIRGKAAITPETALQFETVLGVPASFWTSREQHFRESLARQKETEALRTQVDWIDQFPYRAMMKLGWIPSSRNPVQILQNLLAFFGVASPAIWNERWKECPAVFRKSTVFHSSPGAVAAWLRQGEICGLAIECAQFDANQFRAALGDVRLLTRTMPDDFATVTVRICAAAGVRVVFVRELPHTCAWGATRWMTSECALIQLSLRYKTDDHFWFTFFHEAGHILLHGKRDFFLENGTAHSERHEAEANAFASDFLIPREQYDAFVTRAKPSCAGICRFAEELGLAPGIVVGRLQHDRILRHDHCYSLKKRLGWR